MDFPRSQTMREAAMEMAGIDGPCKATPLHLASVSSFAAWELPVCRVDYTGQVCSDPRLLLLS
jgi:hypothetical protein